MDYKLALKKYDVGDPQSDMFIAQSIKKFFKDDGVTTIIEIGCGGGVLGNCIKAVNHKANIKLVGVNSIDTKADCADYDDFVVSDLSAFVASKDFSQFDIIILNDILEAFDGEASAKLLNDVMAKCRGKVVVVHTPVRKFTRKNKVPEKNLINEAKCHWDYKPFFETAPSLYNVSLAKGYFTGFYCVASDGDIHTFMYAETSKSLPGLYKDVMKRKFFLTGGLMTDYEIPKFRKRKAKAK